MTNILALPCNAEPADIVTFTNADWRDTFVFLVAGQAAGYPASGNIGNGTLVVSEVAAQAALGTHTIEIVETPAGAPARYVVRTPNEVPSAIGVTGATIAAGGLTLSLAQGATAFVVGDTFAIAVMPVPLDVTGIRFDLMLRRSAAAATVSLFASSAPGIDTIVNGGATGAAAMAVMRDAMED